MPLLFLFAGLSVVLLALALTTNLYRQLRRTSFELKPNCLLTRHPVVFITGPRSLFYFRQYWNAYPEILAEHGYEVFLLHLPWQGPRRKSKMQEFLNTRPAEVRGFHFICDSVTAQEMMSLLEHSSLALSVTVLRQPPEAVPPLASSVLVCFLRLSYRLHGLRHSSLSLPTAEDLGIDSPSSRLWLLQRMQVLGEQDFLESR